jgi:zinc protease
MEIRTVTSPGGIEAWLIEDSTVPTFALRYAFEGGSSQDPVGKEGLANFVNLMLQQGPGGTGVAFQRRVEELAIRLEFTLSFDAATGSVEALSETWSEVADLISLALTRPGFEEEAVERVRRRFVSFHGGEARTPDIVASRQWNAVAFAGHAYARSLSGSETSINRITSGDIRSYWKRVFAKDRLKIVAVGDISADELGRFVDRVFGDLPAHGDLVKLSRVDPVTGGRLRVAEMELPQSLVSFGMGAAPYDGPDYIPATILNQILGGGASSRLTKELRQKRGLVASVQTWLERRRHAAILRGRLATRNEMVGQSLEVLRQEMQKMADGHLTQAELDNAQEYFIDSYPLASGSRSEAAARLLDLAMSGLGPGFIERRAHLIAAVTLDDLKRVAKSMLNPENLIISIAGTPAFQPRPTDGQ